VGNTIRQLQIRCKLSRFKWIAVGNRVHLGVGLPQVKQGDRKEKTGAKIGVFIWVCKSRAAGFP
jgi:hypothetical protein